MYVPGAPTWENLSCAEGSARSTRWMDIFENSTTSKCDKCVNTKRSYFVCDEREFGCDHTKREINKKKVKRRRRRRNSNKLNGATKRILLWATKKSGRGNAEHFFVPADWISSGMMTTVERPCARHMEKNWNNILLLPFFFFCSGEKEAKETWMGKKTHRKYNNNNDKNSNSSSSTCVLKAQGAFVVHKIIALSLFGSSGGGGGSHTQHTLIVSRRQSPVGRACTSHVCRVEQIANCIFEWQSSRIGKQSVHRNGRVAPERK